MKSALARMKILTALIILFTLTGCAGWEDREYIREQDKVFGGPGRYAQWLQECAKLSELQRKMRAQEPPEQAEAEREQEMQTELQAERESALWQDIQELRTSGY